MKIKYYHIYIFLFTSIVSLQAQVKMSINEQKTFKDKVIINANKTQSMLSDFQQEKHLSILENTIISEGKLAYQSPGLVKWEYTRPYKNIAIFKDDKLYVNNEGKKDILNLSSNKMFRSLNTLIVNSIKGDMFDNQQFDISYFKTKDHYLVNFKPKDKRLSRFIANFELNFSKYSAEVEQIKLVEPNTDFTLITFKNKEINPIISKATFKLE